MCNFTKGCHRSAVSNFSYSSNEVLPKLIKWRFFEWMNGLCSLACEYMAKCLFSKGFCRIFTDGFLPRARVGYEMISNKGEWNNRFIRNNQEMLLDIDLVDFALQEQPEDNLMVAISRAWYNGSYTVAAKPIKSVELHNTMIQFLIDNSYQSMEGDGDRSFRYTAF